MRQPRQKFYSSLGGFRECFKTGRGALMYHKVGVWPAGVIFKALYVSPELFGKQMGELKRAGFAGVGIGGGLVRVGKGWIALAITFDDGFENVFRNCLKPLAENGFHATQFLVAGMLGGRNEWDVRLGEVPEKLMDVEQVRDWLAAGHEIGAHSMTHRRLDEIPRAEAREEIFASKKKLEDTFGVPVTHFCYPYGNRNEAVREMVAEAGYLTACTADRGTNTADTPPLELKRWMARHPGVRPKEVLARLLDKVSTFRAEH